MFFNWNFCSLTIFFSLLSLLLFFSAALEKSNIPADQVDEVFFGNVLSANLGTNIYHDEYIYISQTISSIIFLDFLIYIFFLKYGIGIEPFIN